MRVGIDIRSFTSEKTGIGWYTYTLLQELVRLHPKDEFYGCWNGKMYPAEEVLSNHSARVSSLERKLATIAMLLEHPKYDVDLYHHHSFISFPAKDTVNVLTAHDVYFKLCPQHIKASTRLTANFLAGDLIKKSNYVIAVSRYTASTVCYYYPQATDKITVVHNGIDLEFFSNAGTAKDAAAILGFDKPYVLYVGGFAPHKNVDQLIRAYDSLAVKHSDFPELVLVGKDYWGSKKVYCEYEQAAAKSKIHILGYIAREYLPTLYANSRAFVFPSLHEGFGLPPVEAMAGGTAVLVSTQPALVEVCEDAALYTDYDHKAIARTLERLVYDETTNRTLRARGKERAKLFSAERMAEQTYQVYLKALT